ncbi:DNA polymerase III subunit gamma and tau [Microtetraspora sp. AC03309]|uniref:DNA polymerase III subunit gamma and tau n=1 Tax=Microtetraspora sp. AC03309 TaxID=2779376 RepID=UPI001E63233B|nr:DNA polymerase III subunit gamma and tau [Microtetraspora sp. AC03309]MCC5576924.1 DNA polymerase III subunit gamma and tau [Microtetraspora sp. AC03309]
MSLALYRKYRPGTFAEVKGQEHVTEPLRQALRSGRINHAYLFSGPRGCGKTSSARILARSLNCEKGPTPDPCGECESCVALAPTGPGHLDVIEIDAASHGGVDDARDLRERAFFAPVSARYKIYIIDEAHMVTREGFNALLKLVEEPPPHLKFVFATTEPEKVIGTIKSRTHHYPFRLMPPATLRQLMEEILGSESVPYEPAALPLVVRAGAGSARDSLSILDQLLAGADDAGITYQRAVSLLGYTDGDLLDEVIEAFAKRDGAAVFQTVNRVVEGGHDPRRFAMDLLERFRDLVILANVPEAAGNGLLDRPADELERLQVQASSMGPAELTRAAEVFNTGLTEMRGATSPRLLLELMCARVLLPAAAQGEAALLARLERLERGGVFQQAAPVPGATAPAYAPPAAVPAAPVAAAPVAPAAPAPVASGTPAGTASAPEPQDDWPAAARPGAPSAPSQEEAPSAASAAVGGPVQQSWPRVLDAIKNRQRVAWMILNAQGRLLGVDGNLVTVGFEKPGDVQGFLKGKRDEVVAAALGDVMGGTWRVDVVVGGSGPAGGAAPRGSGGPSGAPGPADTGSRAPSRPSGSGPADTPARTPSAGPGEGAWNAAGTSDAGTTGTAGNPGSAASAASAAGPAGAARTGDAGDAAAAGNAGGAAATTDESWPDAPSDDFDGPTSGPGGPGGSGGSGAPRATATGSGLAAARSAARAAAQAGPRQAWPESVPGRAKPGQESDDVDPLNDADADGDELRGMALIQRELGGRVIEEIDHS